MYLQSPRGSGGSPGCLALFEMLCSSNVRQSNAAPAKAALRLTSLTHPFSFSLSAGLSPSLEVTALVKSKANQARRSLG